MVEFHQIKTCHFKDTSMPRPLKPRPKPPKNQNPDPGIRWLEARGCWYIDVTAFGVRRTKTKPTLEHARQWKAWATTTPPESKVEKTALTVSDWIDHYLESIEHTASIDPLNALAPSTIAGYRDKLERYVKLYIGDELLENLTPMSIEAWIRVVQSKHTINAAWEAHRRFKGCLTVAVKRRVIPSNPCAYTSPTKGAATSTHQAAPSRWTNEEATAILTTLTTKAHLKSPIRELIFTWLGTGLRIQEIWAIHISSVDFQKNELEVKHTCTHVRKRGMVMREKTKTGKTRIVPFDDFVQKAILRQIERNQFFRQIRPNEYVDIGLLFANERGGIFSQTLFRKWYNRLCVDAKVRRIRPYDIRSTHGSALHFNWGVDEQIAAARLGHSVQVYRDIYVRPLEAERSKGVISLDNLYSTQTIRRQNDLGRQNPEALESKNHTD